MIPKTALSMPGRQGAGRKAVRRQLGLHAKLAIAAALLQVGAWAGAVAPEAKPEVLEIPLTDEFIVIPARIGQADLKLALRTTSFMGVSLFRPASAQQAGISHFEPIRIYGGGAGGGQGLMGQAARGVPLEIAGTQFSTSFLMVPNQSSNMAHAFQGLPSMAKSAATSSTG